MHFKFIINFSLHVTESGEAIISPQDFGVSLVKNGIPGVLKKVTKTINWINKFTNLGNDVFRQV